jgi:hypothetical protein
MITTILKQKYQRLLEEQHTVDPAEFIAQTSLDHNTTPEIIGKLLEHCEWFKLDGS